MDDAQFCQFIKFLINARCIVHNAQFTMQLMATVILIMAIVILNEVKNLKKDPSMMSLILTVSWWQGGNVNYQLYT